MAREKAKLVIQERTKIKKELAGVEEPIEEPLAERLIKTRFFPRVENETKMTRAVFILTPDPSAQAVA
jgi:hypothetical protein